jgi:hypothetical protein
VFVDSRVMIQAAVALGLEPTLDAAADAAKDNSFLARLSLLDPHTVSAEQADKIADLLNGLPSRRASDAGAGAGSSAGPSADAAAAALTNLLRQLVFVDPDAGILASGLRPLSGPVRLSLHTGVGAEEFPVLERSSDGGVKAKRDKLTLAQTATRKNLFYDSGVWKYYTAAGGAMPPTPFSSRKVIAAAVWYVQLS